MLEAPPLLEISLPSALLHVALLLLVSYVTGSVLLRADPRKSRTLAEAALILAAGTLGLIAFISTLLLRRFNVHTLFPLLIIGWSMRHGLDPLPGDSSPRFTRRDGWPLLPVLAGSFAFACYEHGWGSHGRAAVLPNTDLSYWALLAQELPHAGVASQWAAVFSSFTTESGAVTDSWYHWGPIWLTAFAARFQGVSAINAMIYLVTPMLAFMLAVGFAALIQRCTAWTIQRSLLIGFASVVAMAMPARALKVPMMKLLGTGIMGQHSHLGFGLMFAYMLESVIVTAAALAWLTKRPLLAVVFLFCAGISTPHNVAGVCLAAGGLGLAALWQRDKVGLTLAVVIVTTLAGAWMTCHFAFGVSLPKLDDSPMMLSGAAEWGKALALLLRDWGVDLILAGALLPGLIFLIRSTDAQLRALGWMAGMGMLASYAAYHFLLPTGDRGHFTTYVHLVIATPIGIAGLCAATAHGSSKMRAVCVRVLGAMLLMGLYDSVHAHQQAWRLGCGVTMEGLSELKSTLVGRPLGYFAVADRQWWISYNAPLGAVLECPIVRLNSVYGRDHLNELSSFYGAQAPYVLVPKVAGEEETAWSLRFMKRLGIRHVLETDREPIPETMKPRLKLVRQFGRVTLYELADAA